MFYLGQTVLVIDESHKAIGIYLGECESDKKSSWVYYRYTDDEDSGDAFVVDNDELNYIFSSDSPREIYLGPLCTRRLTGTLTHAFGEKYEPEMLNEISKIKINNKQIVNKKYYERK